MWDRHYGICLTKFAHRDVVNSVAFNPTDNEMLVTVSDDYSFKVWRSRNREKETQEVEVDSLPKNTKKIKNIITQCIIDKCNA